MLGSAARIPQFGVSGAWSLLLAVALLGIASMAARSTFGPVETAGTYLRELPRSEPVVAFLPRPPENLAYYGRRRVELVDLRWPRSLEVVRRALAASGRLVLVTDGTGLALSGPMGRIEVLKRFDYFVIARLTAR